ncbi:hypothetical protein P879_08417 [Paragonimus westermani]|uniref:Ankyrin repeat domain-containing protein 39 n=1 Tax=Paragonimus westermani TaxID=34504 RepID=A0A8T0D6N1_9TREM|nr:hypothetical protein P879_08417 [Paragonimus westermani]
MHDHTHSCCSHRSATLSAHQTMDEMDFERSIWYAASSGNEARVDRLLERSPETVNDADKYGYTALHYAARNNRLAICRKLLAAGADVFARTHSDGATAAHRAAFCGHLIVLKELVHVGGERLVCTTNNSGQTCLHAAYRGKRADVIQWLIEMFPTLSTLVDHKGLSPLDVSAP